MCDLPNGFKDSTLSFLDKNEATKLFEALDSNPMISIRYNPYKYKPRVDNNKVDWCSNGFYLPERISFTLDPLFHAGTYYSQEASSMFLGKILEQLPEIDNDNITALDLCAAPGGKTTLLSSILKKNDIIVANETIKSRAKILKENVIKWGIGNVIVCNNDSEVFRNFPNLFDIVVVDTPCSGEGMFRKDKKSREKWSKENVELCSLRSRRIVANAIETLKDEGVLIYSTCTFNQKENEQIVEWITQNYNVENIETETNNSWGISTSRANDISCYRFMPHKTKGEGFFISAMRIKRHKQPTNTKKLHLKNNIEKLNKEQIKVAEKWINNDGLELVSYQSTAFALSCDMLKLLNKINGKLNIIYFGVEIGEFFGEKFKPSHCLATSLIAKNDSCNRVNLTEELALNYLRKQTLDASLFVEGTNLVCYKDVPIGYIKRIGLRTNNLYPKEYRIYNL